MNSIFLCTIVFIILNLGKTQGNYLSLDNTKSLRGLLAILIFLHHVEYRTHSGNLFRLFQNCGYPIVAIFFFLSGYGLMVQYQKKGDDYLKNFLILRLPSVLIPFIIMNLIYYPIRLYILQDDLSFNRLIHGITIVNGGWYIVALIYFYLIFYISFSKIHHDFKLRYIFIIVSSIVYIILCVNQFKDYPYWYQSCLGFSLGIFWAYHKKKISKYVDDNVILCIIVSLIGLITFSSIVQISSIKIIDIISYLILSTFSVILIICLSKRLCFKTKLLDFFGKISFELYMCHILILKILKYNLRAEVYSEVIYTILSFISSIGLAYLLNIFFSWILINYKKLISKGCDY